MNSDFRWADIETRRSKLENRSASLPSGVPSFEFRSSNFKFQISNLRSVLGLLLLAGLVVCVAPASAAQRVWARQFNLPPGGHVSVVNVHGSVLVQGWDRSEVEATVAMRSEAPSEQLDDVQVAVEARSGAITFHTLYPSGLDSPIRVDYRLRVPRQVRLDELSTLEGDIVVREVEGSMEAHNLHGDIEGIDVSGSVVAHALTGNILISSRALPGRYLPFTLGTINGNVDLIIPAQADADLALSTVAGTIAGDYPFQVSSVPGDTTRHARVGAGGVKVEVRTVKGNIHVGQRDDDI